MRREYHAHGTEGSIAARPRNRRSTHIAAGARRPRHEGSMKRSVLLSCLLVLASTVVFAQIALPPGASPQATQDPGYQALIATCKTPPPARKGGPGAAGRAGGAQG